MAALEAPGALFEAKQAFEEKAGLSPVWRLTSAVFGESASDVTPAQFAKVKAFVTATLAIGFATLSMAVSIIVHAKLKSEGDGKLNRMIRAYFARRRRLIYRDVPGPIQFRDRVLHVPVDKLGRVLDPDVRQRS